MKRLVAVVALLLSVVPGSMRVFAAGAGPQGRSSAFQRLHPRHNANAISGNLAGTRIGAVFHTDAVARASGVGDNQLRILPQAFYPATLVSGADYPLDAAGADGLAFRTNHYWGYERLGMQGGYFEGASDQDANGATLLFAWQGSSYNTTSQAKAAFGDAVHRSTDGSGSAGTDCSGTVKAPCRIFTYTATNGEFNAYTVVQVGQCLGETKGAAPDQQTYNNDSQEMGHVQGALLEIGAVTLQHACHGRTQAAPAASSTSTGTSAQSTAGAIQTSSDGFHGNCWTFRTDLWGDNQYTPVLQSKWWVLLQQDYDNNYPNFSGGSTPGPTQYQFNQAQTHMKQLESTLQKGLTAIYDTGTAFGVTKINVPGPFAWATNRVYGAVYYLNKAAQDEVKQPGSGLNDFHTSQMFASNAWDALKQLPCR